MGEQVFSTNGVEMIGYPHAKIFNSHTQRMTIVTTQNGSQI